MSTRTSKTMTYTPTWLHYNVGNQSGLRDVLMRQAGTKSVYDFVMHVCSIRANRTITSAHEVEELADAAGESPRQWVDTAFAQWKPDVFEAQVSAKKYKYTPPEEREYEVIPRGMSVYEYMKSQLIKQGLTVK